MYCSMCQKLIKDAITCEYCGEGPFCEECYFDHCTVAQHGRKPSENID